MSRIHAIFNFDENDFDKEYQPFSIPCTSKMKMLEVIERFENKIGKEVNIKDFLFYHENNIINPELKISDFQKQSNLNFIIISVKKRTKLIKCPNCKDNTCFLGIENYVLHFYGCKYNHDNRIYSLDQYKYFQKIDYDNIRCNKCKKSHMEVKGMYTCLDCSKIFRRSNCFCNDCIKCHNDEDKKHKIINYDDKNYFCLDGCEYSSYCLICKIDLCEICEKIHKNHKIIKYDDISPKINERHMELEIINNKINDAKIFINDLKYRIDNASKILDNYYIISKDIVDEYEFYNTKLRNYNIINTINSLEKSNKNVIEDLDKLIKIGPDYLNFCDMLLDIFHNKRLIYKCENIIEFKNLIKQNKKSENFSIIFTSCDQKIHYSMVCKNTDTINKLESELYKEYPEFSKNENYFLCKGTILDKSKKLEEYNIKNGDIIILNKIEE